ncbi:ABC transporter substrate-binding protein [Noviherbaspirillum saxi]|uniref:Extracellular solute-binding protein n=1 Tax=Noviherbaspirillum saxi TaxID=2320863 RepID=A0A3A3G175_9BURK|nr:extracellular solute-binding protein [Noviherbaspirillum saxi]RJF91823.1 extracellular solute-binding protein [Noviherbaspirillum saxi]
MNQFDKDDVLAQEALLAQTKPAVGRRDVLKSVVAGAALMAVGAPSVLAQGKTLRFLNAEPGRDSVRALRVAAAEYEKKFGVKVVIDTVPPDDAYNKIQSSIAAGTPYDVGTLAFAGHVLLLAQAGKLVPLTKLVQRHKWGPNVLFPIKDENYWYPYDYNFCWMYYRKDLYQQKGLKVPTTWDQMAENCKALTEGGKFGVGHPVGANAAAQWMSLGYMWADGVRLLDNNFKLIVDNAEMKPKVTRYLDFMKKMGPSMPSGMTQALFGTVLGQYSGGQIAHAPYAGRLIEVIEDKAPDLVAKTGFFMYPDSAGSGQAVNHGYDGWVVLNTPMRDESLKFMEWFVDNHYINFLHSAPLHMQPPRMDVYDDIRWRAHPLIEKHAELVDFMKSMLTRKDVAIRSIDTEGPGVDLRPGKMFETFAICDAIQNVLYKGMPPAEAVDIMAAKYRTVL